MGSYHYKAFISYSHKDHRWGQWLHRRLEKYRLPRNFAKNNPNSRLKPIFRDREELSAAEDLSEKIEQALGDSENLIVICSPHAAKSHWVNQEILSFKRQNRGANIFSIIVDGEPFSTNSGNDEIECMPPALRFQLGADGELTDEPAEPLAADLRATGDGKRLGVLKIISGVLGVRLDELVQRDMLRNRNRVTAITAGALITVLSMGTLTGFALAARKEADLRRAAAEDMIEFMITELKPELEAVGRLKPLSIVGERAAKYYQDQPLTSHNDNALGRRARVFHLIGEIEDKHGNLEVAQVRFDAAYASTKALLARDPNNADRIFDHAQSAYWAGYLPYDRKDFEVAETYFQEYVDLANKLNEVEPNSQRATQELAYAHTNLGVLFFKQRQIEKAHELHSRVLPIYTDLAEKSPNNITRQVELANAYAWLSRCEIYSKGLRQARHTRLEQVKIYTNLMKKHPVNKSIKYDLLTAQLGVLGIEFDIGNLQNARNWLSKSMEMAANQLRYDPQNVDWKINFIHLQIETLRLDILEDGVISSKNQIQNIMKSINEFETVEANKTIAYKDAVSKIEFLKLISMLMEKQDSRALKYIKDKQTEAFPQNELFAGYLAFCKFLLTEDEADFLQAKAFLAPNKINPYPKRIAVYSQLLALAHQNKSSRTHAKLASDLGYGFNNEFTVLIESRKTVGN